MKTLIEIPTRGDEFTQPGGIALRYNEDSGEFVVHNYNTDNHTGTSREYFSGGYYGAGSKGEGRAVGLAFALEDLTKRVKRAAFYDAGGSIDLEKLLG